MYNPCAVCAFVLTLTDYLVTDNHLPAFATDANKHWNGLIRDFYKPRVQCYVDQVHIDLDNLLSDPESPLNTTNLTTCATKAELAFTQGTTTK
jgi:hypothetical protein